MSSLVRSKPFKPTSTITARVRDAKMMLNIHNQPYFNGKKLPDLIKLQVIHYLQEGMSILATAKQCGKSYGYVKTIFDKLHGINMCKIAKFYFAQEYQKFVTQKLIQNLLDYNSSMYIDKITEIVSQFIGTRVSY